jgi:hypothetical protein
MPHRTVFSEQAGCRTQMHLARRGEARFDFRDVDWDALVAAAEPRQEVTA